MAQQRFQIYHKPFASLTPTELYAIMQLRNEVFVVEQNCVYQDADNRDPHCHHLMICDGEKLVAYARLLPAGLAYDNMSIGRVISSPAYRGTGAGKLLVAEAIKGCRELFGEGQIQIAAQLYLQRFYESFGFVQVSEMFLEDNIEHIMMVLE